jgi:hypothetical protein
VRPPKKIKVGPFTVQTRLEPELQAMTDSLVGLWQDKLLTVLLDAGMTDELEKETLLHELLHAVWDCTGLSKRIDDDQEEEVIRCLSPLVFGMLRANPDLVEYLTEKT